MKTIPVLLFASFLLFGATRAYAAPPTGIDGAGQPSPQQGVDFLNKDTLAVSVRIASAGVNSSLNFALLDDAGKTIALFYPYEILPDRFWSGPLEEAVFPRVRIGTPVVRVDLSPAEAGRLRTDTEARAAALRERQRKERKSQVQRDLANLDASRDSLVQQAIRLQQDRQDLRDRALKDRERIAERIDRDDNDLDTKLNQIEDLERQKDDLWEQRSIARGRNPPSPSEIDGLTRQINRVDDQIGRLRRDILDLRKDRRENWRELTLADDRIQQAQSDLDKLWIRIDAANIQRQKLLGELQSLGP